MVKKYLPSHATRGTQREVQNAIARSHVTYFSKEVLALTFGGSRFDFFAYLFWSTFLRFDETAYSFNVVAGKTSVWLRWLAWLSNSTLKLSPALQFHQRFGGEIVQITRLARSGCQVVLICHVFRRAEVQWFDYPVRRVTSFCSFYMENLTPSKRITRTGWPGKQPWWGTPPHMWMRSRKKERLKRDWMDRLDTHKGGDPHLSGVPTSMWTGPKSSGDGGTHPQRDEIPRRSLESLSLSNPPLTCYPVLHSPTFRF